MYFTNLDNIPWVPGRIHLNFVGRRDRETNLALTSGFIQWLCGVVFLLETPLTKVTLGGFVQECRERQANIAIYDYDSRCVRN